MGSEQVFDVIVIGSGPGGEGAAMKLSKSGRRVAVIDRNPRVGGGCAHWGTIPSKALRQAVQQLADFRRSPDSHRSAIVVVDVSIEVEIDVKLVTHVFEEGGRGRIILNQARVRNQQTPAAARRPRA